MAMLQAYGFGPGKAHSGYVTITMDDLPFQVRFTVLGGPAQSSDKPTLVLVHGYMCSGTSAFVQWFRHLEPFYRVVVFDNCGWVSTLAWSGVQGPARPKLQKRGFSPLWSSR